MKKTFTTLLCVLVTLALIPLFSFAQTFTPDFQDPADREYFMSAEEGSDDWWEISDGKLMFTASRGSPDDTESWSNIITFSAAPYRDFTLSFDLDHQSNEYLYVAFGLEQKNVRLQEQDVKYGIILWNPLTTGVFATSFVEGPGNGSETKREGQTMTGNYTNRIRMVKEGETFTLYIDNEDSSLEKAEILDGQTPVIEMEIEDIEGYIQFFSGNGECSISNFSISDQTDEKETVSDVKTDSEEETEEPVETSKSETPKETEPGFPVVLAAGISIGVIVIIGVILYTKKKKSGI